MRWCADEHLGGEQRGDADGAGVEMISSVKPSRWM